MKKPIISIQAYTVKDEFIKDPGATIKKLAQMGYQAIELFSYPDIPAAEDIKKWLDEAGIFCNAHNVNWPDILPENIEKTLEYCRIIGTKCIGIGSAPVELLDKRSKMPQLMEIILKTYETVKNAGFEVGYHTHYTDFAIVDGISFWDRVLSNTPDDFKMILDTGNCEAGGGNSMHYINKYAGRAQWVHLKPYHKLYAAATEMGKDSYDWEALVKSALEVGGAEIFTVEYSYDNGKPTLENAKHCFDFINSVIEKVI